MNFAEMSFCDGYAHSPGFSIKVDQLMFVERLKKIHKSTLANMQVSKVFASLRGSKIMRGCAVCGDTRESNGWECPGCGSV